VENVSGLRVRVRVRDRVRVRVTCLAYAGEGHSRRPSALILYSLLCEHLRRDSLSLGWSCHRFTVVESMKKQSTQLDSEFATATAQGC
jgi:hypothetical protein